MKMKKNKFLDNLGLKRKEYGTNWCIEKKTKRSKIWKKQRKLYGFDSRECWNLNTTFVEWLYSHLMLYKKEAAQVVDLKYHKFDFNGKTYTQKECINIILKACKRYLLADEVSEDKEKMAKIEKDMEDAIKLFADMLPCMWW